MQFNLYVCAKCMAMEKHKSHDFLVLKSIYQTTKMEIEKDAEELEAIICPTYSSMIRGPDRRLGRRI